MNLWGDPSRKDMGWAAVEEYGQDMMQAANDVSTCAKNKFGQVEGLRPGLKNFD